MTIPHATLVLRSRILRSIREFFHKFSFVEVETPVRVNAPALELNIDALPSGNKWLRTSPELDMKCILAGGSKRIYQLGPCFRRDEKGSLHNPEFTMLEWYRADADYMDILADIKSLIAHVVLSVTGKTSFDYLGRTVDIDPVWQWNTISGAYMEFAGWDPLNKFDSDRFDMDMVTKIEPRLPKDAAYVLKDFPPECAALSKIHAGPVPFAERWELYLCGIELANAFTELTDPDEQTARFETCANERKALGKDTYPIDPCFINALKSGLPDCAGVALGIDRLVMLIAGEQSIDAVRCI